MTRLLAPTPTRIRARLTAPPGSERPRTAQGLPAAARTALTWIARECAVEESAVLAAAVLLVVAQLENLGQPAIAQARGAGASAVCGVDLDARPTVGELVRTVASAAPHAPEGQPRQGRASLAGAVLVRYPGADGDQRASAAPDAALELALAETGGPATRTVVASADPARVEDWLLEILIRSVGAVLRGFTSVDIRVDEITAVDPRDRARGARFASDSFDPAPLERTLLAPVAAAVRERPAHIALVAAGTSRSYAEVWERAGAGAARLAAAGVGPGTRVVVLAGKSIDAVPALLAVLRCRAAYVPVDSRWPAARITRILADVDSPLVIVSDALRERLPAPAPVPIVSLAELLDPDGAPGDAPPASDVRPEDTAYVMYTSGSTGAPKGVPIRHRAIASYLAWKHDYHRLGPHTRLLQTASYSFDPGVSDVFSVLGAGGTLIIADLESDTPRRLGELVCEHAVTDLGMVPSLYRLVLDWLDPDAGSLRLVMVAGETTTAELVARHHARLPGVRLVNEYGPTECSVAAAAFDHGPGAGPGSPIGHPLPNSAILVCDERGRAQPPGFLGELRIAGHGLSEGYLGRPDLSATAFVADERLPGGRCYRTGDLGWWRPDGMLEFAGRADDQVKIRGQRVELGEVEHALARVEGVRAVAVVTATDPTGGLALVAFLTGTGLTVTGVLADASRTLPPAFLPGRIEICDRLPLLANGKLDRHELAARAATLIRPPGPVPTAPAEGPAEEQAAPDLAAVVGEVFGEVFGIAPAAPEDDFFLLGGHSLLAVAVIGTLEERVGVLLELDEFLDAATVGAIAELLRDGLAAGERPVPAALADPGVLQRLLRGDGG